MNYKNAMWYIKNTAKFSDNNDLSRMRIILSILKNPQDKIKCIHVAGTNGKGSTTAMISKILIEAGYKVGMYTSPFIQDFEERIQINEKNILKQRLCEIVTEVSRAIETAVNMGYGKPTEFEIITCAAFLYFYMENVDYAVIEVGLGGLLDSTNVIKPMVSVITSISYDHMKILGNTLTEIAYQKSGVIKRNIPVIMYPQVKESEMVIEKECIENNSELIKVPKNCGKFMGVYSDDFKYYQKIEVRTLKDYYKINLSLLGNYQILNCSTAIYCVEKLQELGAKISRENIISALKNVKWMGRLEVMKKDPLVVIDGAHNSDGIKNLNESIKAYFKYNDIILILGILADKEVLKMVSIISKDAKRIITVSPKSSRAENSRELMNIVKEFNKNCECIDDYDLAYKKALEYCNSGDLLLISGSLYMIGGMRKIIKN